MSYDTTHSCRREDVAVMDHTLGHNVDELRPMVNRVCLTCGLHWYGNAETAVFPIPARVWDGWMASA